MPHYVVIGGGIIGTSIARELARRGAGKITVLEKEGALGKHASGRNSGVIHSGINQKPGSLKARMCVEGSRKLRDYCRSYKVPMLECGTLVVARDEKELPILDRLLEMGNECGVPALRILDGKELKTREPDAQGLAALFSPTGASVDSLGLLRTLAEELKTLGVGFRLYHKVIGMRDGSLMTTQGDVEADHVINCAGLEADRIAQLMNVGKEYRIIPFRGDYMEVEGSRVKTMIYPPPDLQFPFLGIHLTRETDGRVLAGPSAILALGREAYGKEQPWAEAFEMFLSRQFLRLITQASFLRLAWRNARVSFSRSAFLKEVQSLVPSIEKSQLKPYRSGIRAQVVDSKGRLVDDLLVEYRENSTHILNAVSPGLTCSLAFADYVVSQFLT